MKIFEISKIRVNYIIITFDLLAFTFTNYKKQQKFKTFF